MIPDHHLQEERTNTRRKEEEIILEVEVEALIK
jgi:hypothetical protein